MTTSSYPNSGSQHERETSSSTEVFPQTFTDVHIAIGIEACRFTTTQDLKTLFSPHHSPTTQHIVIGAYRYLMGEISQELMVKPDTDAYEDLDFKARELLLDPDFEAGFSRMQAFLKDLAPAIQNPPFQGAIRNTISIGGVDFDRSRFQTSYNKDPRCWEIAEDAAKSFKRSYPSTREGVIKSLGGLFNFFLFWEDVMDLTSASLGKLIAAKSK